MLKPNQGSLEGKFELLSLPVGLIYLSTRLLSNEDHIPRRIVYGNVGDVEPSRGESFQAIN